MQVTQIDGFKGPVKALVPHGQRCGFTFSLCIDELPDPTIDQQWWGLVPSDQVIPMRRTPSVTPCAHALLANIYPCLNHQVGRIVTGIDGILRARRSIFVVTLLIGAIPCTVKPIDAGCAFPDLSDNMFLHAWTVMQAGCLFSSR